MRYVLYDTISAGIQIMSNKSKCTALYVFVLLAIWVVHFIALNQAEFHHQLEIARVTELPGVA